MAVSENLGQWDKLREERFLPRYVVKPDLQQLFSGKTAQVCYSLVVLSRI